MTTITTSQPVAVRKKFCTAIPLRSYDLECIALAHEIISKDSCPKMTIGSVAEEIGINRSKLIFGFKQVYGMTINTYLEKLRMLKAEELLATTYKPVKLIAHLTRYCTPSRFVMVFKKNYGVTPLQFRKQLIQQSA